MKFHNFFSSSRITAALGFACALSLCACHDSFIFEDEGDCSIHYKLKFRYDMNLLWADAFSSMVKSVRVYAFDEDNFLVKEYMENGPQIADPGFAIDLDLPAGEYHLVAWCGIDNKDIEKQSFVASSGEGMRLQDLTCGLNTQSLNNTLYSDSHLQFLFYGNLDISIEESDDKGGDLYYTMPLVKDTNHIRVMLVQLSGKDTDVDDFTFSIEDANGTMNYKNELIGNTNVVYSPWSLSSAEMSLENSNGLANTISAVADIDISRMTVADEDKMNLSIRNAESGEMVANVPLIQYALLAKDYYEFAYGHDMTPQEFLDRESEYTMTFFLDENLRWINSYIYINSWRVVLQDHGFEW